MLNYRILPSISPATSNLSSSTTSEETGQKKEGEGRERKKLFTHRELF